MSRFKQMPVDPKQLVVFPTSLDDAIPQNSEVRLLSEAMDALDWSILEMEYSDVGCPAYPPRVMAKILIYAYSKGLRSSRTLEDALRNDMRYIWLAGGLEPDHSTLSRFRKGHLDALKGIFRGTVDLCIEANLVDLNLVSIDGSKIRAHASKKSLYGKKRLDREMEAIDRIFREAEEADQLEDSLPSPDAPGELPPELADARMRKQKLREIAERLALEGRKSLSSTEKECRVMKTTQGLCPAYNLQTAVDSETRVIVAIDLSDHESDSGLLGPMLEQVTENTGLRPDVALADTGYCDETSCQWLESNGQDALIPPQSERGKDLFSSSCFLPGENKDVLICPAGRELTYRRTLLFDNSHFKKYKCPSCQNCSFRSQCVTAKNETQRIVRISVVHATREQMRERLKTPEGRRVYAHRQETVELVFAEVKTHMGLDRFRLHGKNGAHSEALLGGIAYNLKVYCRTTLLSSYYWAQILVDRIFWGHSGSVQAF